MASQDRQKVRKRVEKYRKDVRALAGSIQRHRKNALFGDHGFNEGTTGFDQRERMSYVTDRLEDMDDRLGDAQRSLAETEDVALGIMENLGENRMKIESSRAKAREAM